MATVGEAKLRMWVETGSLKKGLTSADSAISSFASRVKSSGASVVSAFGSIGLAINGVSMIASGLASMVSGPLKLAADAEQTAVSFKVMLGSAEQAKNMMTSLTKFAASTPFEMTEITDSAKKLLAFGVASGDIEKTLNNLGNVSAGVGAPMNELAEIFGKIKTSGRVFGEDLNQIQGRGINVTKSLAQQFGVTEDAVKDLVSSGKVNFSHIDAAFASMSASGGQFEGLMAAQSETLGGVFSTMKDGVTLALTEIGTAISDTFDLKGAALSVSGMIETVMPMIRNFLANFKAVFISVKPIVIEVAKTLLAWWTLLGSTAYSIFSSIGGYVMSWLPSLSTMKEMAIESLIFLQFAFGNAMDFVELALIRGNLKMAEFINWVYYGFSTAIPAYLSHFGTFFFELFAGIGAFPVKVFSNTVKNIVKVMSNLPGLISGSVKMEQIWTPLTEGAGIAFTKMAEIPPRVAGDMEKSLQDQSDRLAASIAGNYEPFRAEKLASMVPPETVAALEEVKTKAEATATAVAEIIPEELTKKAKELTEAAMTDLDKFKTEFTELKDLLAKGLITKSVFDISVSNALPSQIKDLVTETETPIAKFKKNMQELQLFKLDGVIDDKQFQTGTMKLQAELTGSAISDLDKFKTEYTQLKELLSTGLITKETFDASVTNALPAKVKDVIEQSKSPMEKFQEQLSELQSFKLEGLINDSQFQSAAMKLQEELFKQDEKEAGKTSKVEFASTAEFGSKEARDAIMKNRFGGQDNKSLEKTSKQQLLVQQQQAGYLKTIASKNQETFVF